ncbi:MAG: hypothetical protein KGS72_06620 [Cyanobacteria bacterium REEB67]|nr:hypothetical protein [Cyanobacteria bacterium REEB67]
METGKLKGIDVTLTDRLAIFATSFLALGCLSLALPAAAREAYQMQNPAGPAPSGPITSGFLQQPANNPFADLNKGGAPIGGGIPGTGAGYGAATGAPNFPVGQGSNSIIQQLLSTRIPAGTVLTGTLNDDLSSHKSEVGDLFSIVLKDGFFLNGNEVIPRNARIVGTVVSVTRARSSNGMGMPGNMSIGLTTLVFPDGRSMPFGGQLDHNPAAIQKKPPKVVGSGFGIKQYGQQLSSMFGSFGNGSGLGMSLRNRGPEFEIKKDTLVPVRVNRTLDLTKMVAPIVPPAVGPSGPSTAQSVSMPGTNSGANASAGGLQADPTALQFPTGRSGGQPVLPKELPEPF